MSTSDIIRAWKNPEFRASLSHEAQALLPAHPVGLIELDDADLDGVAGGQMPPGWDSLKSKCYTCTRWQ